MLNLWFVHSGEVSLTEQIVTQIRLAILSGDLSGGERLPSVRALARRFDLHHNTVSAAYRKLEAEALVEMRRGSGVYVRPGFNGEVGARKATERSAERLLTLVVEMADALSWDMAELDRRLSAAQRNRIIRQVVLVEPDEELCRIVVAELKESLPAPVEGGTVESACGSAGTLVVALPSKAERVRSAVGGHCRFFPLKIQSAAGSLAAHLPNPTARLVGLASRWPRFLDLGRTMLVAAGIPDEALVVRDAREPDWANGLDQVGAVVCDTHTCALVPDGVKCLPFRLLAEESIAALNEMCSRSRAL